MQKTILAAAGGSSAAGSTRSRTRRAQPGSSNSTSSSSKNNRGAAPPTAVPAASTQQQQQRVRRTRTAGPTVVSTSAPAPTNTATSTLDARKNPELYSLATEDAPAAAAAIAPWPLPGTSVSVGFGGGVGSTGAYSSDPHQQHEQQQLLQPAQAPHSSSSTPSSSSSSSSPLPLLLRHKPEVLAPAGGWPQLKAACENGADAVYFGVTGFNARARAANFSVEELPEVMGYLRARGVKGYVALNILVFDEELEELEDVIRHLATAGVDALIVQDIGAVALARRVAPNLPIHGSTQMSITSAEGAEFAASLGVTRVVVGRELSVREIAKVSSNTSTEVEAFCHGALCVSYSGQCFSSEAWGGRSANRGQCAQACRMPYGLIVDGVFKDLQDVSYLLSPQDLMALEQLPDMVAAGVSCFKIEGRLKGPEYVAATTAAYRAGVDAAWERYLSLQQQQQLQSVQQQQQQDARGRIASSSSRISSSSGSSSLVPPEVFSAMAQVFSRAQDETYAGLTPGFLQGSKHQRLVRGRAPRHRGLCLGRVAGFTSKGGVIIRGLLNPVKRGDGVVFDCGSPEKEEQGGSVWEVMVAPPPAAAEQTNNYSSNSSSSRRSSGTRSSRDGGRGGTRSGSRAGSNLLVPSTGRQCNGGCAEAGASVELLFATDQVDTSRLAVGDLVWKNRDPALEAKLRASYEGKSSSDMRKMPVQVSVSGSLGTPLQLQLTDAAGRTAVADTGDVLLSAAVKRALSAVDVVAAVGQLGDNTLTPSDIDVSGLDLSQGLFLPASAWKAVRRAAAEQLLQQQQQHTYADQLATTPVLPELLAAAAATADNNASASSSSSTSSSSHLEPQPPPQPQGSVTSCSPAIRVLCRTPDQVSAALAIPWLSEVIVEFLEVHGLREAVAAVRGAGKQVVVALPRILKPDESRLLWFYLKLGADALLLRGAGPLQQLIELGGPGAVVHSLDQLSTPSSSSDGSVSDATSSSSSNGSGSAGVRIPRLEGDFSLNAANTLSADLLLRSGLSRLCPTHDLNAAQLVALAEGLNPPDNYSSSSSSSNSSSGPSAGTDAARQLEAVVHQHLPIFHTEHCVFCRFLSDGSDYRDCGHPCERHSVQLRDQSGADHLVLADMGCRNTVFNASAQSGLYYLPRLAAAGFGTLRIELVNEPEDFVRPLLETYRRVLQGRMKPRDAWRWLQDNCAGGVAAGSLDVKGERAVSSLRPSARRT